MNGDDFLKLLKMKENYLKSLEIGVKSLGKTVKKNVMKQMAVIALDIVLVKIDAICLINASQKMNLSELISPALHLISLVKVTILYSNKNHGFVRLMLKFKLI